MPDIAQLASRLTPGADFAGLTDVRIDSRLPRIRSTRAGLVYCLNQSENYFIDLRGSFDRYLQALSASTRSTLRRKVRRFADSSNGEIDYRIYATPRDMREYHKLARAIARKTYQEKLFQGALPDTTDFVNDIESLASENRVRGFILFLQGEPVAYLHVPISDRVAEYAFLGYDPVAREHSPGTVLLYLAVETLFGFNDVDYFNFGYGENQTKISYSTGCFLRADIYLFRNSLINTAALYGHTWMDGFSGLCGRTLDAVHLRATVRRWLRSA
jgi:CelD/BcsL family acetyltransferase involved in cellulose biosynthesis